MERDFATNHMRYQMNLEILLKQLEKKRRKETNRLTSSDASPADIYLPDIDDIIHEN